MPKFTAEQKIKNEKENWKARARALEKARERLKGEGVEYPAYNPSLSPDEHYSALTAYGELESKYMLEYLKMPSGPRPVIEFKKEEYKPYKDE